MNHTKSFISGTLKSLVERETWPLNNKSNAQRFKLIHNPSHAHTHTLLMIDRALVAHAKHDCEMHMRGSDLPWKRNEGGKWKRKMSGIVSAPIDNLRLSSFHLVERTSPRTESHTLSFERERDGSSFEKAAAHTLFGNGK